MRSVADALKAEDWADVAALSPSGRVALALALGRREAVLLALPDDARRLWERIRRA